MPHPYQHTTPEQREQVAAQVAVRGEPAPITPDLLAAWEHAHYAHVLLEQAAIEAGDEDAAAEQRAAIDTLEAALQQAESGTTSGT